MVICYLLNILIREKSLSLMANSIQYYFQKLEHRRGMASRLLSNYCKFPTFMLSFDQKISFKLTNRLNILFLFIISCFIF